VRELRGLVQQSELRGLAADLRPTIPAPRPSQCRDGPAAAAGARRLELPERGHPAVDEGHGPRPRLPGDRARLRGADQAALGLAGESRSFDANGQWFRVALNAGQFGTPFGDGRTLLTDRPVLGANPPPPAKRSPLRPDVPCETQQQPDLRTGAARHARPQLQDR
jgi:hypothetical protein